MQHLGYDKSGPTETIVPPTIAAKFLSPSLHPVAATNHEGTTHADVFCPNTLLVTEAMVPRAIYPPNAATQAPALQVLSLASRNSPARSQGSRVHLKAGQPRDFFRLCRSAFVVATGTWASRNDQRL